MRLWHYKLIPVLPNKMLVAEWRECIAIKRQWDKGTLKHRLVSYVKDYDKALFLDYVTDVCLEMATRHIKFKKRYLDEIASFCDLMISQTKDNYDPEHNDRYLKQCYYNLQEKADRGIITKEEWQKIDEYYTREVMGYGN